VLNFELLQSLAKRLTEHRFQAFRCGISRNATKKPENSKATKKKKAQLKIRANSFCFFS
jgi:hypothetical protein